jgi:hypothetical protein
VPGVGWSVAVGVELEELAEGPADGLTHRPGTGRHAGGGEADHVADGGARDHQGAGQGDRGEQQGRAHGAEQGPHRPPDEGPQVAGAVRERVSPAADRGGIADEVEESEAGHAQQRAAEQEPGEGVVDQIGLGGRHPPVDAGGILDVDLDDPRLGDASDQQGAGGDKQRRGEHPGRAHQGAHQLCRAPADGTTGAHVDPEPGDETHHHQEDAGEIGPVAPAGGGQGVYQAHGEGRRWGRGGPPLSRRAAPRAGPRSGRSLLRGRPLTGSR